MTWKRARSKNQKQERIKQIVDATERLYNIKKYEEITFVAIAKEANFTRSNLYKYFSSKEEIFLEFLKNDIVIWENELLESFDYSLNYSISEFIDLWINIQLKHKRLLKLISLLYTDLEKNISIEHLIEFKEQLIDNFSDITTLLENIFPSITTKGIQDFINLQFASAIGLYQMTNLTDIQKEVLSYPEFQHFKIDFIYSYKLSIESIIKNMLNNN